MEANSTLKKSENPHKEGTTIKNIDIILVTFNSEKWIEGCLNSIIRSGYSLPSIFLTFVDNNSSDRSEEIILQKKAEYEKSLGAFRYIPLVNNLGFGAANNVAVSEAKSNYCLLLNIDTEIQVDSLNLLMEKVISSENEFSMWEMKQYPYEHPKLYNPLTREVSWCSGAACMIKRDAYMLVGGFNEDIFMYGEDVDLSWKIRNIGRKLMYVPESRVIHHTRSNIDDRESYYFKKANMIKANIALRAQYGNFFCFIRGLVLYLLFIFKNINNKMGRKMGITLPGDILTLFKTHLNRKKLSFKPSFYLWDYEISKKDEDFKDEFFPTSKSMVSIIIRTIGNLPLLTEGLKSVALQTYSNIEVILVEDGSDKAKEITKEFPGLNIVYFSSPTRVGRSAAGNIGLSLAKGDFLNFLDEDDILLASHIEVLVNHLLNYPKRKIAYSLGLEAPLEPGTFNSQFEKRKNLFSQVFNRPFNNFLLFHFNYFPIQTVMFSKEVFQEMGGFEESLTYLEDWDLWLRYSMKFQFLYIPKVTSIYRVPYNSSEYSRRKVVLSEQLLFIKKKYEERVYETTYKQINEALLELRNINGFHGKIIKIRRLMKNKDIHYLTMLLKRGFFALYYKKIRRVIK